MAQQNKNQQNKNWGGPLDIRWPVPNFHSALTFLHLKWEVPTTQSPKVPTNFYSTDFCSAGLRNFYFTLTFLPLVLGVPVTQCLKIPTNCYSADFCSAGSHNFCSTDFCSTLTFLHLNLGDHHPKSKGPHQFLFCWFFSALTFLYLDLGVPITQSLKVPTNFCSAGSHNFCSTDFCSTLTFLHLN